QQTVQQITTGTTLGASADPLAAGAPVQLTAIVQMGPGMTADGQLTGLVTFLDAGTVLGTAAINNSGQANLSLRSLSVGMHHITANFSGNTNYAASHSPALTETVQQTASSTTLTAASLSTLTGKIASFQAAVSSTTGTPTGTIVFRDGATVLATLPVNANGAVVFSTTQLSNGPHEITASYSGDANYTGSVSAAVQVSVGLATPVVTLSVSAVTVDAGLPLRCSVQLASNGIPPTGTMYLLDGSAVIASQPVSGTGNVSFSVNSPAVGPHTLTSRYSGDANNAATDSAAVALRVQQAPTSTKLTASANPLTQGQVLMLSANVASDSPAPGGTISFFDGSALLGSVAVGSTGSASFSTSHLATGVHQLTASYAGDTDHAHSASVTLPELVVQALSLTASSDVNPSVSGQTVMLRGRLSGSPAPTGTLSIRDGNVLLTTVPLDGTGAANFSTAALAVGSHVLVIGYSGDTNYAATNTDLTQTVLNATTSTLLSADVNPATFGSPVSFAVKVASNGGTATGQVHLMEGDAVLGSAVLDGAGEATIRLGALKAGAHQL
ncbi:MAG: Ig-like domain repeat protein, partial [Rhodospirillales bacterium]|nr:Ig-like domain repeat protein [Acetobacter sp.]